mmetsp:Transcript_6886/g.16343  ORF Transcript_6886/g.16343 Transcript_6886/m.16343 type:complete len:230 (-) Transcript_6886:26-715(-)
MPSSKELAFPRGDALGAPLLGGGGGAFAFALALALAAAGSGTGFFPQPLRLVALMTIAPNSMRPASAAARVGRGSFATVSTGTSATGAGLPRKRAKESRPLWNCSSAAIASLGISSRRMTSRAARSKSRPEAAPTTKLRPAFGPRPGVLAFGSDTALSISIGEDSSASRNTPPAPAKSAMVPSTSFALVQAVPSTRSDSTATIAQAEPELARLLQAAGNDPGFGLPKGA